MKACDLKTYCLQFVYSEGNGWAIVRALDVKSAELIFLAQSKYKNAKVTSIKEERYYGENAQLVYEGAVQTQPDIYDKDGYIVQLIKGDRGDRGDAGEPGKDYYNNRLHVTVGREYDSNCYQSGAPVLGLQIDDMQDNETCCIFFKDKVTRWFDKSMPSNKQYVKLWEWTSLPGVCINKNGILQSCDIYSESSNSWNSAKCGRYKWLIDHVQKWLADNPNQAFNAESLIRLCERYRTSSPLRCGGGAPWKEQPYVIPAVWSMLIGKHNKQQALLLKKYKTNNEWRYDLVAYTHDYRGKSESLDIKLQIVEVENGSIVKYKDHVTLKIIKDAANFVPSQGRTIYLGLDHFPLYEDISEDFDNGYDNLKHFSIIKIKDPMLV